MLCVYVLSVYIIRYSVCAVCWCSNPHLEVTNIMRCWRNVSVHNELSAALHHLPILTPNVAGSFCASLERDLFYFCMVMDKIMYGLIFVPHFVHTEIIFCNSYILLITKNILCSQYVFTCFLLSTKVHSVDPLQSVVLLKMPRHTLKKVTQI